MRDELQLPLTGESCTACICSKEIQTQGRKATYPDTAVAAHSSGDTKLPSFHRKHQGALIALIYIFHGRAKGAPQLHVQQVLAIK